MSDKYLDGNGVRYLWEKIKNYVATHGSGGSGSISWDDIQGKPEILLKGDIVGVYRYCGSVVTYASLPTEELEVGDVYNVESTGMNYAWTGAEWDALGESFKIDSISNAEIDEIVDEE